MSIPRSRGRSGASPRSASRRDAGSRQPRSPRDPDFQVVWWFWGLDCFLALVLAVTVWLVWPTEVPVVPTDREYRAETGCLLTDERGLGVEPASTVWSGMSEASEQTLVKIQFQAVAGPQTEANAIPYLNGLVVAGCGLVVGVGDAPVAAVLVRASEVPGVRFAVVGDDESDISTVTFVNGNADQIRSQVRDLVAEMI